MNKFDSYLNKENWQVLVLCKSRKYYKKLIEDLTSEYHIHKNKSYTVITYKNSSLTILPCEGNQILSLRGRKVNELVFMPNLEEFDSEMLEYITINVEIVNSVNPFVCK